MPKTPTNSLKKVKDKTCKICGSKYLPRSSFQLVCGYDCAYEYSKIHLKKESKKLQDNHIKKLKQGLLTHGDYIGILQTVFNTYIRTRDKNEPCISCGCTNSNKWDAGHFYPTTFSYLRFNEDNVHKQCSMYCNMKKRGNLHEYRIRLIEKIGIEKVNWLEENRHKKLDLTIQEIKDLIKVYKMKISELKISIQ